MKPVTEISPADIEKITSQKILFAHMSVGQNIIQGITEWKTDQKLNLQIHQCLATDAFDSLTSPGLYHFMLGNNANPFKKLDVFRTFLLTMGNGAYFDRVLLKLCYVDVTGSTDIDSLFQAYSALCHEIRTAYPKVHILHCTVPLTVHHYGLKQTIKEILRGDQDNMARAKYNKLLRDSFRNDGIIDIAGEESTTPQGTNVEHLHKGFRYTSLWSGYSDDGGHLNRIGRKKIASAFVTALGKATP